MAVRPKYNWYLLSSTSYLVILVTITICTYWKAETTLQLVFIFNLNNWNHVNKEMIFAVCRNHFEQSSKHFDEYCR